MKYQVKPKDGAFYGPKIDVQIEDAIGRSWQVATIQLYFVMLPERFELEYVAEDGSRQRPVAIHRAIFGSFEQFIGIITEHFAGELPLWIAPLQAAILPITDAQHEYAAEVHARFRKAGIRAEFDNRNEKIGIKLFLRLFTAYTDVIGKLRDAFFNKRLNFLGKEEERINETMCCPLSPVVGTHAGPGTVALNFMAGIP